MELHSRWRQAAGVTLGATALCFTFACNGTTGASASAAQPTTGQGGAPVVVTCEPHQRTLVRQAIVNGAAVSQVECVAAMPLAEHGGGARTYTAAAPSPSAAYVTPRAVQPAPAVRRVPQPVHDDLGDAEIVPASTVPARPVRTRQVVYDERPVKKTRSTGRSAVIIGSSAGAGAGVGAAVGGKKGALIGAAIGGGGAAVWDQITRRK